MVKSRRLDLGAEVPGVWGGPLFFFFFNIYLFIWLCWVLVSARGILVVACELLVAARVWDQVP